MTVGPNIICSWLSKSLHEQQNLHWSESFSLVFKFRDNILKFLTISLIYFFETGSHCVALVDQKQYLDQEGLKLIEILLPLLASTGIKGVGHCTLKFTLSSIDSDTQPGALCWCNLVKVSTVWVMMKTKFIYSCF